MSKKLLFINTLGIPLLFVLGACATLDQGSASGEGGEAKPLIHHANHSTQVGLGSYASETPNGFGLPSDFRGPGPWVPVVPKVTENIFGSVPTNDWWSSLVWQRYPNNPYSENMYPHPLTVKAKANGLALALPENMALARPARAGLRVAIPLLRGGRVSRVSRGPEAR